ncbi:penicillin-binding protein 1C [Aquimarina agarilytica]|uniref:penicillin-binding protein 1C n=1 Tax=Aquimarina agarilytica TaxID=1087449 RepID=UPI0002888B35|nr:penicillin-binding protein 1C [Aquimarina agarilytica]
MSIWYLFFSLPNKLFDTPTSTVLFDANQQLIAAKLANDEQWRFSNTDSIPYKFEQCLLQFEDAYFYYHPGFNPISITKALISNLKNKKVVRGGSTITMQTIRLSRNKKSRTVYQKLIELILATRLELSYSKKNILKTYISHTPYGGNIVGLNAAAWRYYNRSPHQLSWAESATLAVLPNAPSLIYPGKNHDKLKQKRNRLLDKLLAKKIIDSTSCFLAKQEPIPERPKPLPQIAQHLLDRTLKKPSLKGKQISTTLKLSTQSKVLKIVNQHRKKLKSNHIYNSACLVLEINTGKVLAYVGNTPKQNENHGQNVDIITSARSTGSILKPFLYASSLQDGLILPNTLLPDIPTQIAGYTPKNYNKTHDGAVPAKQALARSLNIPAVRLLRDYKYQRFHNQLQKLGLTSLTTDPNRYGLSLILGGAEATLWELSGIYASLAKVLKTSNEQLTGKMQMPYYTSIASPQKRYDSPLNPASIWLMLNAMKEVGRPLQEMGWQYFNTAQNIAWKTGTSFGNRDAWSIGISSKHVVGVWVGNADGEGRAELTGINSAAPIMFDVFNQFNTSQWFTPPYYDLYEVNTCRQSGFKAGIHCKDTELSLCSKKGTQSTSCPYHKLVHLSKDKNYQVNSSCASTTEMTHESWFVLPPIMEWYYKKKHSNYKALPKFKAECTLLSEQAMEIIYPKQLSKLFIPKELNGKLGKIIFKIAHRNPNTTLFWHIDNEYIGQTINFHELAVQPKKGKHQLILVDTEGKRIEKWFEIIE